MPGAAVCGDAVLILAGQPPACERGEDDGAGAALAQHAGQPVFDPAVEQVVARLVDEQRRAQRAQNAHGLARLLRAVVGNADVERLAAAHDLVKRAHRLLHRRVRVGPVVVEDVHVVKVHAAQALIEAGDEVLAAAPVAVGAGPHVIAGLGGDDHLVAVGQEIALHVDAEAALGLAVGRAVVVGEVEVGDAVVKRRAQDLALHAQRRDLAKVMPKAQRERGQQQAALTAAAVGHRVIPP